MAKKEAVNHPPHYGGDVPYEVIKVIEAWEKMFDLSFNILTCIKYLPRAGHKDVGRATEDLKKARWYLDREIAKREAASKRPRLSDLVGGSK